MTMGQKKTKRRRKPKGYRDRKGHLSASTPPKVDGHGGIDLDALLCALILAPNTFSRNRFFQLFEDPEARRVRRRANRVRGIIRQLVGDGKNQAQIIGERVMEDGQVILRYRVEELDLSRSTALSALEAAAMRFALSRAGLGRLSAGDRDQVEEAFAQLSEALSLTEGDQLHPPE